MQLENTNDGSASSGEVNRMEGRCSSPSRIRTQSERINRTSNLNVLLSLTVNGVKLNADPRDWQLHPTHALDIAIFLQ